MSCICPSCKSDRCGNHAACARRNEAKTEREAAWICLWFVVGCTERMMQMHLANRPPFAQAVILNAFAEDMRRTLAVKVMDEMERRTR